MSARSNTFAIGSTLCFLVQLLGCVSGSSRRHPATEAPAAIGIVSTETPSETTAGVAALELEPVVEQSSTADIRLVSQPALADPVDSEFDAAPAPYPDDSGITVAELERIAMENNPALRQLSAIAYQAAGVRDQVGVYPNPTVGYFGSQLADEGTDQHGAYVDQEIVMGDKLWLNERVLNAATRAQVQQIQVQRMRVLTDIRVQFYAALGAQRRMELAEEFEAVAAHGVEIATQRRELLEGTQAEVLQAEILLQQAELTRQQAEIAMNAAWQELAAIAGVPHWQNPGLDGELDSNVLSLNWDEMYGTLLGASPELAAARSRVSAARANVERQQAQPIPNLLVNVGAGYDNSTDHGLINMQVGAPLPVFNTNDGNVRAAYGEYCSATHNVRRIEMSLRARLAATSREYDSSLAAVRKYHDEIVPSAERSLELTEQQYSLGEASFLEVLTFRRTYFDTNLQYVTSLTELAQARAQLDGLLLSGGLDQPAGFEWGDELRGQTFSGQ
ncbi:MAG: TolC family protein [Thermomicrobiales bacterium]